MKAFVKTFWLTKDGNSVEEYDDAFYLKQHGEFNNNVLRFAVADGASEGIR
jgi:serine/threonine protein phosphatase PrpC